MFKKLSWEVFQLLFQYYSLSFSLSLLSAQLIILLLFFNIHVAHKGITQEPEINYPVHRPNQFSLICNSCLFKKGLSLRVTGIIMLDNIGGRGGAEG